MIDIITYRIRIGGYCNRRKKKKRHKPDNNADDLRCNYIFILFIVFITTSIWFPTDSREY